MDGWRDSRVTTSAGAVMGFAGDGVVRWHSIPYAQPPVGALRFRAPQPAKHWEGVRDCTTIGFAAPQRRMYTVVGPGRFQPTSEDCLTLNVVAPLHPCAEPLPVMVFIHGGGWMAGTSNLYNGAPIARRGCVVVSVNYRLGALGCLDLSSLSMPDVPIEGNLYLRDIACALQWVHDNITGFGGDPKRVVVFGESAGAHTVAVLMAMPLVRGLFSGAIIQSSVSLPIVENSGEVAERFAALLGARRGEGGRTVMKAEPEQLIAATERLLPDLVRERPGTCALGPSIDGDVLPEDPIEAMAAGRAHRVPVVVGSNADEATMVTRVVRYVPGLPGYVLPVSETQIQHVLDQADPATRRSLLAAYPGYPGSASRTRMAQDGVFGQAVWNIADAHGRHQPTYVYRYDYAPRTVRWLGLGASHATELLAVFDGYRTAAGRAVSFAGDGASARRVSDDMIDRWIAFADSAVPGAGWPTYREDLRAVMVFDRRPRVELDPDAQRRVAWRDYEVGRA